jgi:methionine synthase II (cobalamin-independent)
VSVLDRLPAWTTTGVGSLPFTDPAEAVAHATGAYGLPFCPQLPRLEGDMISEWLGADPGRCGWSPGRDRERPAAWDPFVAALRRRPPAHRLVKLQVTGPATLACALEREGGGRPSRADALGLAVEVAHWLAANAAGQVARLAEIGLDAVLVVDEPALGVFGKEGVERVWEPLRAAAPAWGLHLCCHVPWEVVDRADPDLISFDLALDRVDEEAAARLRRMADRGTWIAWGALRVASDEQAEDARRRVTEALASVQIDPARSLLTPSCGSGRMSRPREHEIAVALRTAARSDFRIASVGEPRS